MNSKLLSSITNAYAVMLDKRIGNWSDLKESFKKKGIDLKLFLSGNGCLKDIYTYGHIDKPLLPPVFTDSIRYETWFKSPNPYNCWMSQKRILQKSIYNNADHLFLIEDDSFIEEDFDEILSKAEPFFENNSWDAIYFGGYHRPGFWEPTNNENVIKVKGSGGLHCCLLGKKIIHELMNEPPLGPLDWILGQKYHNRYNCYSIYPSIVSQKSGFSHIEMSNLEKPNRFTR